MSQTRSPDAGLSLIEVLVSLAIFAVIGVAGLAVLDTISRTSERTEGRLERLADIDRAFLVIRRDLAQITRTQITLDADGIAFGRLRGDGDGSVRLAFALDGTTLTRQVDQAGADPVRQSLLNGVIAVEWRLLDGARRWHPVWPPAGADTTAYPPPLAAELTLDILQPQSEAPQPVTRLIVLPAGQGR